MRQQSVSDANNKLQKQNSGKKPIVLPSATKRKTYFSQPIFEALSNAVLSFR